VLSEEYEQSLDYAERQSREPRDYEKILEEVFEMCKEVCREKQAIYRDHWKTVPIRTLMHVLSYKAKRLTFIPWNLKEKQKEELIDIINYAIYILCKL